MSRSHSMIANLLLLFAMVFPVLASAQGLTLSAAQQSAERNSPMLSQKQSDVAIAEAAMDKAAAPNLPQVYVKGQHVLDNKPMQVNFGLGAPVDMPSPLSDYSLGVSWTLFDARGTHNQYQASKLQHDASTAQLQRAKFELDEQVRMQFYQVLGAQALVEVSSQNVQVLKAHLRDARNMVKQGALTRLDLLKVEVQLEDAQNDLESARDNAYLAKAKLAQTMGVRELPGPLEGRLPDLSRAAYERIDFTPGERLDQKALLYMRESAQHSVRASHAMNFPRISLFGQEDLYSFTSSNAIPDSNFKDAYTVGINFSWDIYDGGAKSATQRMAREQLHKQEERIRQSQQAIPVSIDLWKRKLAHDISAYQAGITSTQKSTEAVRLARDAMRLGTRTNTDVLDAEQDLNYSRLKVVRAQVDAVVSLSNLELALGKRVDVFGLE